MEKFNIAYKKTLAFEGGYSYDPDDRGGETYRGISRKFWANWDGWKTIDIYKTKYSGKELEKALEKNEQLNNLVKKFYHDNYWLPLHLYNFHMEVANELFDTAVNQGKWKAASYLQKALNKLNRNGKDYNDITVDGNIGKKTLQAYTGYMATQRFASRNTEKLIKWLIKWLNYYQLKQYDDITNNDPSQEKYIPGWTERS